MTFESRRPAVERSLEADHRADNESAAYSLPMITFSSSCPMTIANNGEGPAGRFDFVLDIR